MEDFEYSVEICDSDWECFFAECEECNLLPPSLAGVDDSGMSDFDDTGSLLAKRVLGVDLAAGFSEADRPIDGPPDCEGSPVEHYLSKHVIGGLESVLSGSEEDIHLQSVNIFYERLKNLTEGERPAEPCQVRKSREAVVEVEQCSDGQQSSSSTLPRNIPKLNPLPARGETAVGIETARPVDTVSNINTMKEVETCSSVSPDSAAGNTALDTDNPETELFIREEGCTESRVNETTQPNQFHDLLDVGVCPETRHAGRVTKGCTCTPLKEQEYFWTSQFPFSDKCRSHSPINVGMVTNVKWMEEQTPALQLDVTSINKSASQGSSPSASIKRKRRTKRRFGFEPAEIAHGYERRFLKSSDSEEEQFTGRGGLSDDVNLFCLNEPQRNSVSSLYSVAGNLPGRISAKEIKAKHLPRSALPCDGQHQLLPDNIPVQGRCEETCLAEHYEANGKSVTALSQTDDNVMSATCNSVNVETHLQPCIKLQVEELIRANKESWLPVPAPGGVFGQSDTTREMANSERKHSQVNHSISGCENIQNLNCCTAEVKFITHSISSSEESSDPAVGVGQNENLSDAKSVLAGEAGNSVRDNHTVREREAESQQQLEIERHDADQFSSSLVKTLAPHVKPQQFKTGARPFTGEISREVTSASNYIKSLPDKSCLSKSDSDLEKDDTIQQTMHLLEVQAVAQIGASQFMTCVNQCPSGEIKLFTSKDLITSPSHITPGSSCCSLHTDSVTSLSNENCLSVYQNQSGGPGEKTQLILAKHQEGDAKPGHDSPSVSNGSTESKCGLLDGAEDAVTASKAACGPDSEHSVFAMSSFWSEMEKLTINDILGLRMIGEAAPACSLPPLQESQETDALATTDSGFFTQMDESKQTHECMSGVPDSVKSSSDSAALDDSSSSRSVTWDGEPVPTNRGTDVYPGNMMLTSASDVSRPVLSESAHESPRMISKNVSVHNLHALKSFSATRKGRTLQTLDEGESEMVDCLSAEHGTKRAMDVESPPSSFTDSYRISITDVFQFLFGGNQSTPSQSTTDDMTTLYTDGNSVPETYHHFFSEFDTENFFCPLITADSRAKDEPAPIFSSSRSAGRNLQFPEVYDCLFASSSSDDSSVESDDEDRCGPVRVVTRFSRKAQSTNQISTDIYENFFTDSDLRQNFFWDTTLSFRNKNFPGFSVQKQTLSHSASPVPVRQSPRSLRRTVFPSNALGNPDVLFADPLHLENRIPRQQARQPFRCDDLQAAISNPRLDASLLPLRQSDMCLVCIAFASWVLKTTNPEVGDAWKAVLLANVSALSAIGYLRKYVKEAAADGEKKSHVTPSHLSL